MIDLRKPLEGVPGLLPMSALILFGAAIGIAVAIVIKWIDVSDAVANFLGGVVGAGLGAALAVLGAVYVQSLAQRVHLAAPINSLSSSLGAVIGTLSFLEREFQYLRSYLSWLLDSVDTLSLERLLEEVQSTLKLSKALQAKLRKL